MREALMASARNPEMLKAAQSQMISLQTKTHTEIEVVIADYQAASPDALKKVYAYTHE